jgi:hypothetical protein
LPAWPEKEKNVNAAPQSFEGPHMSIALIKQFCKTLLDHDIISVQGSYDGSCDSGDMTITLTQSQTVMSNGQTREMHTVETNIRDDNARALILGKGLVKAEVYDQFIDALWQLLPGGWEINDGAYGEVIVDTRTEKITVEHNERYTDVNTSNYAY